MAIIPCDIIPDILIRLPAKSLVRFKCVCKAWKCHIESSDFIQTHLHRSLQWESDSCSFILTCGSSLYLVDNIDNPSPRELTLPRSFHHNNDTIKVVGSCNGLLCIASGRGSNHFFLCNPSYASSFKMLPLACNRLTRMIWRLSPHIGPKVVLIFGFGHDQRGEDYKIIYAWCHVYENSDDVLLYSLKAGSWKSIENPGFGPKTCTYGVLLNNCLHWCVSEHKVLRFELHDEEWSEVDLPDFAVLHSHTVIDLAVFEGCLSATVEISDGRDSFDEPEFWVMREYNVKETWTKLFTLPNTTSRVLSYSKRRHQVLLMDEAARYLGWYSLQEKKIIEKIEVRGDLKISEAKSLVGSLVPIVTKRTGQENGDEGNPQERKGKDSQIETGESSSTTKKGGRGRKKRN